MAEEKSLLERLKEAKKEKVSTLSLVKRKEIVLQTLCSGGSLNAVLASLAPWERNNPNVVEAYKNLYNLYGDASQEDLAFHAKENNQEKLAAYKELKEIKQALGETKTSRSKK